MTASAPAAGETLPVSLSCRDRFRAARQSVIRDSPLPLDFCRNGCPTRRGVTLRRIFWYHRSVRASQAFSQMLHTGLQYRTQDYRLTLPDSDVRCKCSRSCNEWSGCLLHGRLHENSCVAAFETKSLWNSDNYETL